MNIPRCVRSIRLSSATRNSRGFHTTSIHLEASSRRLTKSLRVPPAQFFTPPSSASQDHIIFNPPSSAPNVHHTPFKFLPEADPRRALYARAASIASTTTKQEESSPVARTRTALSIIASRIPQTASPVLPENTALPPPVRQPYQKKYHLGQAEVDEIRRLRKGDPFEWTRSRLAKKFDCSQFFIQTVVRSSKAEKAHQARYSAARSKMSRGRKEARDDRTKRRALWGRE